VSETIDNNRRWSGFVCPDCRFVFRVPLDLDGKGIVCPSCRRILRIPTPGYIPPPLMASPQSVGAEAEAASNPVSRPMLGMKRRGRKKSGEVIPSWDKKPGESFRQGRKQQLWMLVGGGLLFVIIVAGVVLGLGGGRASDSKSGTTPPALSLPVEASSPTTRTDLPTMAEIEVLAGKFLNATTVDELLPLVRNPQAAEPRMRRQYPDGIVPALGLTEFNITAESDVSSAVLHFMIRTRDHEDKILHFVTSSDGTKIDWESWIGWSDMTWAEFRATKPTTSQVFRLELSPVEYFNFDFKDESKWRSYMLLSPDQEHALYGYVELGGLVERQVRQAGEGGGILLMLALRYPENAASDNQVIIERFVNDRWVENEEAK